MDISVELAQAARKAALSVGPYLREAFAQDNNVSLKADFHDPVTVHDRYAQEKIVESLFRAFPDSLVVGEESDHLIVSPSSSRIVSAGDSAAATESGINEEDIVWYVDPIDGTSNFAAGFDHWCVSIAAAQAGKVIAAAIYQPTTEVMYHADSSGAYKNGRPIYVSGAEARQGIIGTEFPSPRVQNTDAALRGFLQILHSARSLRRTGSTALMLAEVASGNFVGSFNVGTHSWDVAAGALLVMRAGGCYIGWDSEKFVYEYNAIEAPNYVAAGSQEVASLCLEASGHPDPRTIANQVWADLNKAAEGNATASAEE